MKGRTAEQLFSLFYFEMKVSSYMADIIDAVPGFIRNRIDYLLRDYLQVTAFLLHQHIGGILYIFRMYFKLSPQQCTVFRIDIQVAF